MTSSTSMTCGGTSRWSTRYAHAASCSGRP
jgi:hypothetical protein